MINQMEGTLRWKKTIGILAIILGALRFITGISAYSDINSVKKLINDSSNESVQAISDYLSFWETLFPLELMAVLAICVLGIVLLCLERDMPLPGRKSRSVATAIFTISILYLVMEFAIFISAPSIVSQQMSLITILASLGFIMVLIVFCVMGLYKNTTWLDDAPQSTDFEQIKPQPNTPINAEVAALDLEIAELKKQIEKRKLEKEFAQLEAEKQTEIEKLKKELEELK